jgi:hypothetical protein
MVNQHLHQMLNCAPQSKEPQPQQHRPHSLLDLQASQADPNAVPALRAPC